MPRGLGSRERYVLDVCRRWAAAEPRPGWRWVPLDALAPAGSAQRTRSAREVLRRAVYRLAERGLVERGTTGYKTWLLRRHAGDAWSAGAAAAPPVVQRWGGHRRQHLVVRLPLSPEDRALDEAEQRGRWFGPGPRWRC